MLAAMRTVGPQLWRAGALAAISFVVVLALGGAPGIARPGPPTVPGGVKVPGVFEFYGIACPVSGACIAVGEQGGTRLGVIDAVSGGVPARPVTVRGTFSFGGVACPRAGYCIAIGQAGAHGGISGATAIVPISNGRPGRITRLRNVFLYGIGCGSSSSCWATGETSNLRHAVIVHLVGTRVAHVFRLSGVSAGAFYFFSSLRPTQASGSGPAPVCVSPSECIAVGTTGHYAQRVGTTGKGLILTIASGRIVGQAKVPGTSRLDGISCTSPSDCIATADPPNEYGGAEGLVLPVDGGRPGALQQLQLQYEQIQLGPIACPATGTCYIATASGAIVPVTNGIPATTEVVPQFPHGPAGFHGIACQGSSCVAAGNVYVPPGNAVGVLYPF